MLRDLDIVRCNTKPTINYVSGSCRCNPRPIGLPNFKRNMANVWHFWGGSLLTCICIYNLQEIIAMTRHKHPSRAAQSLSWRPLHLSTGPEHISRVDVNSRYGWRVLTADDYWLCVHGRHGYHLTLNLRTGYVSGNLTRQGIDGESRVFIVSIRDNYLVIHQTQFVNICRTIRRCPATDYLTWQVVNCYCPSCLGIFTYKGIYSMFMNCNCLYHL